MEKTFECPDSGVLITLDVEADQPNVTFDCPACSPLLVSDFIPEGTPPLPGVDLDAIVGPRVHSISFRFNIFGQVIADGE